ncbi:envelope glycoprotein K [bovine alphaherpesvirus 1]|uniref:Envelope glycoprotein K n=1 Tax=Bovine herpesvirus 1 TaxID=10320 RepID=K4P3M5_BHV1|nr:glycoprotein K [Bovine herpesvirus type 1.1]ALR87772.1 envelope glycoprotein K [Bovine alphaherpesvirus 1]AFV53365.1 glycoprotein K [Bovine herpesvirus type 1.1]AVM39153.1 envelope glycoprotein K [Bovine alphaherpesvirus 1]AVM39377.1 envelope glycoprotein K [Bovine alphaherpesvirus 1]AVM39450.1 envelope glycoprotein K [Bovine alphaherpesvirus 1]
MLLGGRTVNLAALALLTAHLALALWAALAAPLRERCALAVRATGANGSLRWELRDPGAVYVWGGANNATLAADAPCRHAVVQHIPPGLLDGDEALHGRVRAVAGARDCRAYLWSAQARSALLAWLLYVAFVYLRQERRMFGICRNDADFLSPGGYTLNYAAAALAAVVGHGPYTKLARLMCELSARRRALAVNFRLDPLGCAWRRPGLLLPLLAEGLARLGARIAAASSVGITHAPCAAAYPLYLKIWAWVHVALFAGLELVSLLYRKPARRRGGSAVAGDGGDGGESGIRKVCVNCCSTLLAGLLVKALYLAAIVGGVIALLHYEHNLRLRLLGAQT